MAQVQSAFTPINQMSVTDFVASALRLVGSLSSGESPTSSEINDGGMILNQMLDAWSSDRVSIFYTPRVTVNQQGATLTLNANQASYTLGNTSSNQAPEDFYLPRPPRIEGVSVMYAASQSTPVEIPLEMYDDREWQSIANKTTVSILPQVCHVEESFPDMTLFFWPVPSQANPIALYPYTALTQFTDYTTKMAFPPAYAEAIRYNLAKRLFAEFPGNMQKYPLVDGLAKESFARIVSANSKVKVAWVDEALLGDRPRGNIYAGSPSRSKGF